MVPEYFWDYHHGGDFTEKCNMTCVLAESPSQPDALFFMSMGNGDVTDAINYPTNSIKILGSLEAKHYYSLHDIQYLNQFFQGTALLDWTSDVPWLMMYNMDELKAVEMPENPAPNITFVARNCNPMNNRMDYVKAIDKLIGVVAMSSCYHNTPWPRCEGRECTKQEAIRGYKIHLAFENGNSPKYVTAKIYHALAAGVLPVWMGTRDIAEAVPKGSYIDVANFASPDKVAQYLVKVLSDDDLYQSYFEWKGKPFEKEFEDRFRVLWAVPFECRMCRYIEALLNGWEWDQKKQVAKIPVVTPIENSGKNTPIENSGKNTPIENSGKNTPIENSGKNTPIENSGKNTPIENSGKNTPIEQNETKVQQQTNGVHRQPIIPILFGAYRPLLGNDAELLLYTLLSIFVTLTLLLIFKKSILRFFQRLSAVT